ncbi:hypothetical protein MED01_003126 [Micromonospora sp. MED01]|uniref:hypothetical protein n=1 Tax=Micromonospora alfalfae TaxID=2911212 RepID=UPI001EE82018|nr:hypothetical protein [Micromonospora alfalfae]MCG5464866.1 hypothetical protein [Micromonospora alfalfae]
MATIAAFIALGQAREARRLRKEQAQPYVVAFMEPAEVSPAIVDLVIRNFGTTAAYDIEFRSTPPLQRSGGDAGGVEDVWVFDKLPILAPGQEWRTVWDFSQSRGQTDLPDCHDVLVCYKDSQGKETYKSQSTLDWSMFKGRRWTVTYGAHDSAKALREIQKTLKKWQEDIHGGLRIYVRDGAAKDEKRRQEYEKWESKHEVLAQRLGVSDPAQNTLHDPVEAVEPSAAGDPAQPPQVEEQFLPMEVVDPPMRADAEEPAPQVASKEMPPDEVQLKQRAGDGS